MAVDDKIIKAEVLGHVLKNVREAFATHKNKKS